MRKMLSKALSVVLALCMIVSVLPVMSFAASQTTLGSTELNLQSSVYPHPFSTDGRATLRWPDLSGENNVYQSYWQVEGNYDVSFDNATPEAWAVNGRDASHPNAFVATNSAPCDDALGTDDPNYNLYTYSYSCMSYEFMGDATLSFDWRASCEDFDPEGYSTEDPDTCLWDSFVVAIDGVVVIQIGGETGWQHFGDYEITGEPTDSHKIAWMYTKDAGYGQHEDCAFVDNIVLTVDNSVKLTADELNLQSDLIPHPFSVAGEAMLTWDDTDDVMDTYSQSEWAREEYASYYEDYEGKTAYAWEQVNYDAAHPTALKSTNTEEDVYSTYSAMSYTFSGPTTLSFDYLLAFETCDDETNTACDTLELIVDNRVVMQKAELLDNVPAWKTFSYEITGDGEHNVIWVFNRDFFDSGTEVYDRAAYVDNITVEVSGSCDLSSAKLTYKENGVDKVLTANGGNLSYAAGTVSDLCVHFDDDGETIYTLKIDGVEVTPVNGVYAIADAGKAHSINIIAMRPGFMAANWSCSTTVSYELNDIITEAPEGAVYSLTNDATYPWTAIAAPDGAAAQSGNKGVDSSESNLTLNVTVPAGKTYYVVYRYAVSSETNWDKLFTYYDATKIGEDGISGYNSDGEPLSQVPQYLTQFALSEGTHTIKWSYGKDSSGAHGNDAAYVMDIRILETQLTGSFDLSYNSAKGTVSKDGSAVSGTVSGMAGGSYTLTETPAAGCYFVGWYSGETLLSAEATYSGTFGLAPDAIEARFDSATATSLTVSWDSAVSGVTCSINEGEAFALTNGVAISTQQADVITLTASSASGVLKGFYVSDTRITPAATYTFTFGESDVVLNVKSAENNEFAAIDGYVNPENITVQTRPRYGWSLNTDGDLASGNQGIGNSVSILKVVPAVSGILNYKYKTSSEAKWDCLYYSGAEITNENFESAVNYEQRENYSGTHSWTEDAVVVQAGVPIYFGYRKDSSGDSGQDTVWLKDFSLETSVDNKNITIVYPEDCGSVANAGSPVSSGTVIPIPAGTTCSLTAEAKNMAFFLGWYIGETCVSSEPGYTFKVENDVTVAARFNPNTFADVSGYTTGTGISSVQTRPRYPWSFADGILTSGNAGQDNTVSILKIVPAITGLFSFDYKTSSEAKYDVLYYSVGTEITDENCASMPNHEIKEQFSGEMADWVTFTLPVEAGNVIYLGFHKDGSRGSGSDCAQVRNLQISSGNVNVTPISSDSTYGTVSGGGMDIAVGSSATVTATPAAGGQFYGWVMNGMLVSESSSYTFTVTGNVSPKALFAATGSYVAKKNDSKPDFYATLTEAFADAQNGECIRLISDVTVNEDVTVPAGVTFLLPYSSADSTGTKVLSVTGMAGEGTPRVSWNAGFSAYETLTIAQGATLTVNGSLIIGGVQHYPDQSSQGHTSGAFSQIVCNGNMIVNGSLINYGLIKGSGTTTVKNGAAMKTPFLVTSYSGGTNTENLYSSGSFPFTQFATVNVQDTLIVEGGATVTGLTSLYFSGSVTTQDIALIGTSAGLILLPVGSTATLTYDASKRVNQTVGNINLSDFGKTTVTISGGATAGLFDVSGYGSASMYLNIPYTYDIVLTNGTYTMSRQYRIMPGASVTVADGATLNVTGGLQVTDGWQQADKSGKLYPSTAELANNNFSKSGALIVNGTLNVTGTFGGIVQTTAPENATVMIGATAKVAENFTAGCTGGYTDDYVSYSLPARAWVDGDLTNLAAGTYYGKDSDAHTLESYTMAANRISGTTVTINQPMTGTWSQPGITFESNGGSAVAAINAAAGSAISAPAAPTREGYSFAGWYANADLSGDAYVFTTMPRTATKLYAKWTANTYSIVFDANGGEGTMAAQTFAYGDAATALADNAFSKAGYSFTGWNTAADGTGTAYADKQSVQNLSAENGAEIRLYAQWSANTYTVTLDPNGGAFNAGVENTLTVTYGSTYGTIPTPRKTGYNFGGWYLSEEQITAASTVSTASDHTLTAHWNEIADAKYTVYHYTEDLDGEYSQYEKETFYGVPDTEVTAAALSIPGFTYFPGHEDGWATDTITENGRMVLEMYYSRNSYTLSYKDGDTSVLTADSYKFEEEIAPQSYSKDGYTFEGWFANAELTEAVPATMPANDVTLYAKFAAVSYTVSYISDGSEVHTESVACDAAIPAYTPEKTGYHFVGWYADEACETAAPATMPASNISLYAAWEKNSYTVTIHHQYNGEQIHEDSTQSVAYLETVTDPVLALDGYYFTDGNITPAVDTQLTSDTEMTVSYNSYLADLLAIDSATFSDDAVLASARALYAKLNDQQKAEYTGTEHQVALFDAIKTYSESQLKAAVHAAVDPTNATLADPTNEYIDEAVATIKEDAQKVDVALLLPDYLAKNMLYIDFLTELFGYKEIKSIQINGLPAYVLTGTTVAQNPAGSDQFRIMFNIAWSTLYPDADEGTVMNLLRENEETLTNSALDGKCVTAIVSAVTVEGVNYSVPYQISFFNNSHNVTWIFENGDPDQTKATDYGSVIEKPTEDDPTKTGYEFVGWQGYTENMKMGKTDVTFTAQWTANEYTVTLEPNGGTLKEGDSSELTVTYDGTYALPTPLREGYTFAGWYLGQKKIDNNSTVIITEDKTFEAHWEVGQGYPIVYVLDGGVLEAGKNNPEQYNVETESFALNNPVREGYTFLGWTGSNGEAQQTNVTVNKGTTGALSFTANWEINKYTITYNTDGGSLIASVTQDYGTAVTPPADPTKIGYSFNGWDTVIPVTMPARSMEIKALWTINQYTITFNTDGGDILDPITQNYGTPITAPADPSRIGYTFKGWYEVIPETMPAENMTITAKWSINQHTITFVTVEDSVFAEIKQNYGTPITVPADPSRIGYTFKGWYEVIPETMPDQDMTITAKWTANTYTVSFDANGGSDVASKEVTYDAPFGELASSERAGYEFLGWYTEKNGGDAVDAETIVSLTEDTTLYAHWNRMGEIPYRVEHYLQDVEGDGYTLVDTANLTGPTDAPVEAKKNAYNHFTCNSEKSDLSGVISGDGTSVLKIYYDRELFTVTWKLAGREITECYRYQAIPSCKESTARADDDHATYSFSGWDKEIQEVTADITYTAQYQASYEAVALGGQTWRTLRLALENAKPGDTVRIEKNVMLSEDAAVPAGVTLLLPCMDEDTGYVKQGGYLMSPDGTDTAGGQGIGPNAKLYRSLTVAESVTLTVSGSLLVNAVTGRPSAGHFDQDVTGGYAQLDLLGNVTVENGGHLDAFGFVKGSGLVSVKDGGTVGDLYVVRHWRGGTQALKMYEADLYPMNEYDCHNIESMICIEYGGSLEGIVKMYAGGSYNYTRFPQVDNNNGLIRLKNPGSYLVRTYADGRERYEIYGGADFSNSTLKIVGMPLSTGSYIYPIDGDIDTVLNSGEYRFVNDFKYLPGATVMVNSDAELTVTEGHTVVFYQEFNNGEFTDNTRYPARAPALLRVAKGAKFTNAGTFAGAIYTESADILIGAAPTWEAVTYEANCMASGRPKEEHTLEIAHTLSITRPAYTWKYGEDLSIVWTGGEADYSAVEAAKALIPADLSEYTEESVKVLTDALAAVEEGMTEDKQAQVDAWAKAIRDALTALVRKDGRTSADYSAVMAAMEQMPGDLSLYTDQTREALTAAVNAVRLGLLEDEQVQVDAWAKAITEAIAALVYRPADYSKVEEAKKNIPADLTGFSEESVKTLNNALAAVKEGFLIDRQAQVDAWAKAIEAAIAALKKKPCDGGNSCPGKMFKDMPDAKDWAHEGIDFVIAHGLFNGMNTTTFAPDGQMTRAMLVTVLWRLADEPKEGKNSFADVEDGVWYTEAVAWASKNGVVDGIGGGKFAPADIVTREQLATILYRYAGKPEATVDQNGFADQNKVSTWAKDAMCWAIAEGIIRGFSDHGKLRLNPQKGATRAEVAAMIMRFAAKYA